MPGIRGIVIVLGIVGLVGLGLGALMGRLSHPAATPATMPSPSPRTGGGSDRYFSPDGRFSIAAPGRAIQGRITARAGWGRSVFHAVRFVTGVPHESYVVSWTDLPHHVVARTPAKGILRTLRNHTVRRHPGRIVRDAPVTVSGYPGRDLFVEVGRFSIARIRTCLARARIYQVVVVTVKTFIHPDRLRALRFLWSFRVASPIQYV
jgi:hypothetical protein